MNHIKSQVNQQLDAVTNGLMTEEQLLANTGNFRLWRADCQTLLRTLQKLNFPGKPEQIDSIHDLIFLVHSYFVDRLGDVAEQSGQGEKDKISENLMLVNFPSSGWEPVIDDECIKSLADSGKHNTVFSMHGATIITRQLNCHSSIIEAFESDAGGKERTLKFRVTDEFKVFTHLRFGKFRRFLFMAMVMNALDKTREGGGFRISVNKEVGEIFFEINRVSDLPRLRSYLNMVIELLNDSLNKDYAFEFPTAGIPSISDFDELDRVLGKLNEKELVLGLNCLLFQMAYLDKENKLIGVAERVLGDGSDFSNIISFARMCSDIKNGVQVADDLVTIKSFQEFFKLALVIDPELGLALFESKPHCLSNVDDALELVSLNYKLVEYLPDELKKDKRIALAAIGHSPEAIEYIDKSLWDDLEVMETLCQRSGSPKEFEKIIKKFELGRNALLVLFRSPKDSFDEGRYRKKIEEKYGNDKELIQEALKHSGNYIKYASDTLKDDESFIEYALGINDYHFSSASKRLQSNKRLALIAVNKGGYTNYDYVSESLKNDREIVEPCIASIHSKLTSIRSTIEDFNIKLSSRSSSDPYAIYAKTRLDYYHQQESKFEKMCQDLKKRIA